MRSFLLVASCMCALACSKPAYKIKRDAPTKVETGDHYSHFFEASEYDQKNSWASCNDNAELEISEIGQLSFFPDKAGSVEVCVALLYDGDTIDEYKYTVVVAPEVVDPNKARFEKESKKLAAAMKPKLAKARQATRAISRPGPRACPEELAKLPETDRAVYAFPEVEPNWTLTGLRELEQFSVLEQLSPAELRLMHGADAADKFDKVKHIATRPYAMLYRHTVIERPKVVSKKRFEGGKAEGWAFVVELAKGVVVCQTRFAYVPPSLVTYKTFNIPGGKPDGEKRIAEHYITQALHQNGAQAFAKTLQELAPGWSLGVALE